MITFDIKNAVGEYLDTSLQHIKLTKFLGRGKSGYSYLGTSQDAVFTVKFMHDEPCPYYSFGKVNKVAIEVKAYHILKYLGIPMPELFMYDLEQKFLIKEYIDGVEATELIADGTAGEIIEQLYEIARIAQNAYLNLDYFPANFVVRNGELFYVDFEFNPYDAAWNLYNWGIFYWANTDGMRRFLDEGDSTAINQAVDSGIPIKEPFRTVVENWNNTFQ